MTDTDWYARRLGTQQPAPPQYQQPPPQYQPQPQGYPQQQPQGYPQQQPQQQQIDPSQIKVTGENLFEATKYWQGGEAHRKERNSCPECGGNHYYSRSPGVSRGPTPAPMCFDCGYNGMFQQGDPASWGAGG